MCRAACPPATDHNAILGLPSVYLITYRLLPVGSPALPYPTYDLPGAAYLGGRRRRTIAAVDTRIEWSQEGSAER